MTDVRELAESTGVAALRTTCPSASCTCATTHCCNDRWSLATSSPASSVALCDRLTIAGVRIDADVNVAWQAAHGDTVLSPAGSEVSVVVIPAGEEAAIARISASLAGG